MRRHQSRTPTRKTPRWVLAAAAATSAAMLLAACTGTPEASTNGSSTKKPVVLTTFTVLADIARNIAGDHLDVRSITKPGAEIHGYEPTPGDIAKASDADLILDNGLNLEQWFTKFVSTVKTPHAVVSAGITPINITEDAYAGKPNPHAWMSPSAAETYVDNMVAAFSKLDPAHANDYRANANTYKAELHKVRTDLTTTLKSLPENQRALVTCEGAFSYLAKDAGLTEKYIWPVNAEQQATPQQITSVIDFVRNNKIPAVFCESTVSDKPMKQVVEATGTTFGGTLYVDSLSAADGPVPTYLDLIRHDAKTIADALTGKT
ncbi:Uncharacterized periplasmic iron-binding protein HI_0362 precursor [Dermatophilus congolensis]|uniref:Uncharacterized periplasmic iron-binding protein HI_0362 n=2 Tax=Dermatophilus congolensis TaxID=1863 RepID=A0A239VKT7_9MICO|nr:Uncharacterized periplasmic iron-binding protein HI_0362 precursor [Dermatophilus congolensis]